jgi:hypothetical protein
MPTAGEQGHDRKTGEEPPTTRADAEDRTPVRHELEVQEPGDDIDAPVVSDRKYCGLARVVGDHPRPVDLDGLAIHVLEREVLAHEIDREQHGGNDKQQRPRTDGAACSLHTRLTAFVGGVRLDGHSRPMRSS